MTPAAEDPERIEIDAWRDCCAAAPPAFAAAVGLEVQELGGPLLALCRGIDHYQFNRLIGAGLGADREGRSLEVARQAFAAAGLRNGYLQIAPGAPRAALEQRARALGLQPLERPWVKFARGPAAPATVDTELEVEPVRPAEANAFGAAVAAGFGMPAALAPWLAALVGRAGWHTFVARLEG